MRLFLVVLAACAVDPAPPDECIDEGHVYFAKSLGEHCCDPLDGVSTEDIPRDDYTQDDYPPGCGPDLGVPPDLMVCIDCGDGVCGIGESFCNCATDCAFGESGPPRLDD